jgi:isoquinoline 1-oxidoreductase beta subunit
METAIDELAHLAKKQPLVYRRSLLKKSPRHLAVLDLLEKHGGFHQTLHKGHALGLAIHESFGTVVGHVAHVSVEKEQVKIHKIVSAVHCGTVVNPDSARMQVEGAIVMGLSAMLYGQIGVADGEVVQSNFADYPVLRMREMPKIEVHFVKTADAPTGLGEPGLPPVAPAVANAIFKITGKRVRKLPLQGQSLTS